jgi:hypothetical protein
MSTVFAIFFCAMQASCTYVEGNWPSEHECEGHKARTYNTASYPPGHTFQCLKIDIPRLRY